MIGQHPELVGLPELKLFCCGSIRELEASLPQFWKDRGVTHRSPGLVRALAEFQFGGQTPDALAAARMWLGHRQEWTGADVLDVLLELVSPRTPVEKSPDNLFTDDAFARMADAYPHARYLHLTRHPVSTQRSMQEHLKRTVPGYPADGEPMSGIGHWYAIHRRVLIFAGELPQDRYFRVRAEDVLNDTENQLRAIAAWLGICADGGAIDAMRHPERSPFARPGPALSGVTGGSDPGFLRDPIPRRVEVPARLDPPEGWVAEPVIWEMIANLANQLGY